MHKHHYLANAVLWAAAIVASAILGSAPFLTTVLLPVLAAVALLIPWATSSARGHGAGGSA
jgi:hypothetical protein